MKTVLLLILLIVVIYAACDTAHARHTPPDKVYPDE